MEGSCVFCDKASLAIAFDEGALKKLAAASEGRVFAPRIGASRGGFHRGRGRGRGGFRGRGRRGARKR